MPVVQKVFTLSKLADGLKFWANSETHSLSWGGDRIIVKALVHHPIRNSMCLRIHKS